MKVLQIANGYCGNRLYKELFRQLRLLDVDLSVFVPLSDTAVMPTEEPKDVKFAPCFNQLDRAIFYKKQKKMLDTALELWDISQFQVIHAHTVFSGGYTAWKLHRRYGIPYVVAVRNTDRNVFFRYMIHLRHVGVNIMREAAKIVFLSPAYQEAVIETYIPTRFKKTIREKSIILPNGVSDTFMKDPHLPHLLSKSMLRLVYVGEISKNKNIPTVIEAIQQLQSRGLKVVLSVAGAIREKKYEGYFEQYPFVNYLGPCQPEQVKSILRSADIFVMPSHKETFGLVYAEAMSQGLPVIYTRGEGFDGQFTDGTVGYAVDDKSATDVAEKIMMVKERYEELSWNAYEQSHKFAWNDIARAYRAVYEQIIE